ncbi:MAG: hypothetical protein ACLFR8_13635 [Alkalispirochaeta sp.]
MRNRAEVAPGAARRVWRDVDGTEDSIHTEQTFLSRETEGEWWYISLSDGEYRIEYEYSIGTDEETGESIRPGVTDRK